MNNWLQNTIVTLTFILFLSDGYTGISLQVMFILAKSRDSIINHHVKLESQTHKDIIQGDFVDSYRNLTHKTLFILNVYTKYYKGVRYLMKIDDNVGLNLGILLGILKHSPETDFIMGHVLNESVPIRKQCDKKWYLSEEIYDKDTFPTYAEGPAYILTQNAAREILKVCPNVNNRFHLEDVMFTGLCRKRANITIKHDERFCQNYNLSKDNCATRHKRLTDLEEKQKAISRLKLIEKQ